MSRSPSFWRRVLIAAGARPAATHVAVIVGLESGNRTVLSFAEFASEAEARHWCERMNRMQEAAGGGRALTRFEYEEIA